MGRIINRTFSRLESQASNNSKILAIHIEVDDSERRQSFTKQIASDFVRRLVLEKQAREEKTESRSCIDELVDCVSDSGLKSTGTAGFASEFQSTSFLKVPSKLDQIKTVKSQTYQTKPLTITSDGKPQKACDPSDASESTLGSAN